MRMLALAASLLLASTASASFFEDFEGGIPGTWTLTDYAGNGGWNVNTYFGDDNWTSGGGICADINSDYYGSVDLDAALISPLIAIPARTPCSASTTTMQTGSGTGRWTTLP